MISKIYNIMYLLKHYLFTVYLASLDPTVKVVFYSYSSFNASICCGAILVRADFWHKIKVIDQMLSSDGSLAHWNH